MNQRYILFLRAGVFYYEDRETRKQISLRTRDRAEALTLLHAKNEAARQPVLNLQMAQVYLAASDPEVATRTWQTVTRHSTSSYSHKLNRFGLFLSDSASTLVVLVPRHVGCHVADDQRGNVLDALARVLPAIATGDVELYDHATSAGETKNVADQNPKAVSELKARLEAKLAKK